MILVIGLVACSPDRAAPAATVADAYAGTVRWFVDRSADPEGRPPVFVEARGEGVSIGLETQAAVVSAADGFADVRFIDHRSEALDTDGVRDGGIFLALGAAVQDNRSVTIDVDEILSETSKISWEFVFDDTDGSWRIRGDAVPIT